MAECKYRVGFADESSDDDPWFASRMTAIATAIYTNNIAGNYWRTVAVWDDEDEVVCLVYTGEKFRRVP